MLTKNTALGIISFLSFTINAMELEDSTKFQRESVFVSHKLGDIDLYHSKNGFSVYKDGKHHPINSCFIDKSLRNLNKKQLDVLQKVAQLEVKKFNNSDEYTLKLNHRGKGGGPLAGLAAYATVSVIGWTAYAATAILTGGQTMVYTPQIAIAIKTTATAIGSAATATPTP